MTPIMQITYQLMVLSMVITLSVSRPQNSIENQETADSQSNIQDLQKYYSSYRFPGPNGYVEETNPIERLQMQIAKNPLYSSSINGGGSLPYWDPMFRIPEMKRQVRYRQCYFNPISCFKK